MSRFLDKVNKGLCGCCGKPNKKGSIGTKCNAKKTNSRNKKKKQGICVYCENIVQTDHVECVDCRNKKRDRRRQRFEQGLCRECSSSLDMSIDESHVYCQACLVKMRNKSREKAKERFAEKYIGDVDGWSQLEDLYKKQGGKCAYSGLPLTVGVDAHIDHIIPKSRGGKDEIQNYQWVLRSVNLMKHSMLEEEFLSLCKKIIDNMSQ